MHYFLSVPKSTSECSTPRIYVQGCGSYFTLQTRQHLLCSNHPLLPTLTACHRKEAEKKTWPLTRHLRHNLHKDIMCQLFNILVCQVFHSSHILVQETQTYPTSDKLLCTCTFHTKNSKEFCADHNQDQMCMLNTKTNSML